MLGGLRVLFHAQLNENSIICTNKTVIPANCYNNSIVICKVQISINCSSNNVCYGQNSSGINIKNNTMQYKESLNSDGQHFEQY